MISINTTELNNGISLANAAGDALSVIVSNISQLDSRTNEIAATSEEQAQATGIISANVKVISTGNVTGCFLRIRREQSICILAFYKKAVTKFSFAI